MAIAVAFLVLPVLAIFARVGPAEIVRQLGAEVEVVPVSTDEFPRPAPRPAYSALDTTRLEQLIGRGMPPWQAALERYLEASCAF